MSAGEFTISMTDKQKDKTAKNAPTDADAIEKLSLSVMPLSSNTLKSAKLIKNSRMETAVELYNDPISGSLQIMPEDIADQLATTEQDQLIIRQLASLNSYDVYSLRSSLKKLGLEVSDPSTLQLSDGMKEQLAQYTAAFTRPLIEKIFGVTDAEMAGKDGLQKILRDPDINRVRTNLKTMTERTGIPLDEIPKFLEEYSDMFLSVAYYRYSFESVGIEIERFLFWVHDLRTHRDVISSPQTLASCKKVEDSLRFISGSIRERLGTFQSGFEKFWSDINKSSFKNLHQQIEENHASMGSVLCGLVVKMQGWAKEFPDNTVGGPQKRAKFVVTELEPGIEKLKNLEHEARAKLGLAVIKT
jgi:hypothetical protein